MGLEHRVEGGFLWTRDEDWFVVEDLRSAVRSSVFDEWHLWRGSGGTDPSLYERYRAYMAEHGIPYAEEEDNGARWFILRRQDDAYQWGVEDFGEEKT